MKNRALSEWLTSPVATGKAVAMLLLLNTVISSYALGSFSLAGNGLPVHMIDICSGIVAALTLYLIGLVIQKKGEQRAWQTTFAWLAAAAMFSLVPNVWAWALNKGPDIQAILGPSITGTIQVITLQLAFTMVVKSFSDNRSAASYLESRRQTLQLSQSTFAGQRSEIEERIRVAVADKLQKVLNALQKDLNIDRQAEPAALAKLILGGLNQGVRPLSWEIEAEPTALPQLASPTIQRISIRTHLTQAIRLPQAFNTLLFTLICVVFEPVTAFYVFGIDGALQILATMSLNLVLLATLRRLTPRVQMPAWLAVAFYSAFTFLTSLSFVGLRALLGQTKDLDYALAFSINIFEISAVTSILTVVVQQRRQANQEAELINQQLEIAVARVRQVAWQARQRFARLVHGPVQSKLLAAYLQLNNASDLSSVNLNQITQDIAQAAEILGRQDEATALSVQQMTTWVTEGWGSEHSFDVVIDPNLLPPFVLDSSASAALYETLRESVNNAIKYGSAGSYAITIQLTENNLIELTVVNPVGTSNQSSGGYGTAVLDQVTYRHSLEIGPEVAVFKALIATAQAGDDSLPV